VAAEESEAVSMACPCTKTHPTIFLVQCVHTDSSAE
jgi:hypothetical protein